MPSRRSPRPVGAALDRLRDGWAPETTLAEVQQVWGRIVGEAIAREAVPVSERGGVLTISCSASVWAQELDLMAPVIVDKLNGTIRNGPVAKLRCTAAL